MANTHLEHLEDDILNNGSAGGKNAVAFLRELGQMLTEPSSNIRITTKWDGAPAVVNQYSIKLHQRFAYQIQI